MTVEYKDDNVLVAARRRVADVFDHFERVVVSISGGKDSTVLFALAYQEACRRGREVVAFFLDQEAEWLSSIEMIQHMMTQPGVTPAWYQVPCRMTNAASHRDLFLHAWEDGAEWLRHKNPLAIHAIDGPYADRFYTFFTWLEEQATVPTAYLVGLRSKESLNRFRAVTRRPGYQDWAWTTATKNPQTFRAYPIYDWTFADVWKHIHDEGLRYNRHYDRMFAKYGVDARKMRVSNLVHEKSFHALADVQEFEPELYDRILGRVGGIHAAARYAAGPHVYAAKHLPAHFRTWRGYRDHLLATTPGDLARYRRRFAKQAETDAVHQAQVRQLLCNDWENNLPVKATKDLRARWWDVL